MFCPPDGDCVSNLSHNLSNLTTTEELAVQSMPVLGLVWSNAGDPVRYRKAVALDAQAKVSSPRSIELAREQWKVEAQQLFKTSLAKIQITLREIARRSPDGSWLPEERDILPPAFRHLCNIFKFLTVGWRNVSVVHLPGMIAGVVAVLVFGITTEDDQLWNEKKIKQFAHSALCKDLLSFCKTAPGRFIETAKETSAFVNRTIYAAGDAMRRSLVALFGGFHANASGSWIPFRRKHRQGV